MTQNPVQTKKRGTLIIYLLSICLFFSLFVFLILCADGIKERMLSAFTVAYRSLIPTLFPFMILSDISVHFLIEDDGEVAVNAPQRKRWTLILSTLLGILFGFPIGAKIVRDLYNKKMVTFGEAKRLLPLANQTSFAFVTLVLGRDFLGSFSTGCGIYSAMILSATLVFFLFKGRKEEVPFLYKAKSAEPFSIIRTVRTATLNMLYIVAFLVIFSIPMALLDACFGGSILSLLLSIPLELSGGCQAILRIPESLSRLYVPLFCFCVSFGGICVGMQSEMYVQELPFSMRNYYNRKILQGIFAFVIGFFIQ